MAQGREKCVLSPRVGIQKATLKLVAKFFWILVPNRMSLIKTDNIITWDRQVMVVVMVTWIAFDFPGLLLVEIHEKVFKLTTTYTFPCMIFKNWRNVRAPILYVKICAFYKDDGYWVDTLWDNVEAPREGLESKFLWELIF